jgi:hypothetical protein
VGGAVTEPRYNRHKSRQDFETPAELLDAVARRFGSIRIDLAATAANAKAPWWLGPGSEMAEDALAPDVDWNRYFSDGVAWLNPEFGDIEPWAAKCAATTLIGNQRIALLTPASIGSNWFARHVLGCARVFGLSPRLTFVGATSPYPKDCMLSVWGDGRADFDVWRWKP